MGTATVTAEPVSRCKICGDAAVVAVCHHCAAALCATHAINGASGSREFRRLDARRRGRDHEPNHCADCVHRILSAGDIGLMLALTVVLAGLVFVVAPTWIRVVALVMVAATALALFFVANRQRRDERLDRCSVMPEVENERIVETYRYRSTLSAEGRWHHQGLGADGVARVDLRFNPDDVKRVAAHASAGDGNGDLGPIEAGFVVLGLDDPIAIDGVNVADDGDRFGAKRVTLEADRIPFLLSELPGNRANGSGPAERLSSVHHWSSRYQLRLPDDETRMPIQIFPTLAPGSDRRSLELHVRLADTAGPMDLAADRVVAGLPRDPMAYIESLEFRVPLVGLGDVVPIDGDPIIVDEPEAPGGGIRKIRWEQVDFAGGEIGKRLSVRFERPIPPNVSIDGRVAVFFEHSLAGVTDLIWFDAKGRPSFGTSADGRYAATTASVVDVAFRFSMASLPYEASFVHMERSIDVEPSLLQKIRPDHKTAIEIAHRLTESGFVVSQLGESTFAPSDRSAEENRVWELRGRYFENTAPLDFQLKIVGADLRRRLEGSAETYQVTAVTLAAQAGVDGPGTLAEFEAQLRTIEEQSCAALVRLAGRGPSLELAPGDEDGPGRPPGIDAGLVATASAPPPRPLVTVDAADAAPDYDVADYRQERRCSMCSRSVDREPYALCHHCGRVVCLERCSVTVRQDPAFVRGLDRESTRASHCERCAEQEHRTSFYLHRLSRSHVVTRLSAIRR